jgi:uncharacterized protein (TIGR00369 family)
VSGAPAGGAAGRLHRSAPCHELLGRQVVRVEPGSGESELHFLASDSLLNGLGDIQGGFLAAMLDSTMGAALATQIDPETNLPTVELKISYVRPGKPGLITGHGHVVHRGRSLGFVSGELRDAQGRLIASATATHLLQRGNANQKEEESR